jgi:hypothetical protein
MRPSSLGLSTDAIGFRLILAVTSLGEAHLSGRRRTLPPLERAVDTASEAPPGQTAEAPRPDHVVVTGYGSCVRPEEREVLEPAIRRVTV